MSALSPNPFASPAAVPQPNVMGQFDSVGVDVPMMTPGMSAIAAYRARGGRPMIANRVPVPPQRMPPVGGMTPSPLGGVAQAANTGLGGYAQGGIPGKPAVGTFAPGGPITPGGGVMNPGGGVPIVSNRPTVTNAAGVNVGPIRPPRNMMPNRAY